MAKFTIKKIIFVSIIELVVIALVFGGFYFFYLQKGILSLSKPSAAFKTPQKGIIANIINDSPLIISGEGTFVLFGKVKSMSEKNSIVTVVYTDSNFLPVWINSQSKVYRITNGEKEVIKASQIKANDIITIKALYNFKENTWITKSPNNIQ
ncbi:MAG TPA: hypothetical protein PKA38_05460 [Candidatus Levybacteria bacterium]|jgi:hypothetical protein|nr:hypothetical protein [Candidatus Levybacteria bacterium]